MDIVAFLTNKKSALRFWGALSLDFCLFDSNLPFSPGQSPAQAGPGHHVGIASGTAILRTCFGTSIWSCNYLTFHFHKTGWSYDFPCYHMKWKLGAWIERCPLRNDFKYSWKPKAISEKISVVCVKVYAASETLMSKPPIEIPPFQTITYNVDLSPRSL